MAPELPEYVVNRALWTDGDERNILHKHGLGYDVTDRPPSKRTRPSARSLREIKAPSYVLDQKRSLNRWNSDVPLSEH